MCVPRHLLLPGSGLTPLAIAGRHHIGSLLPHAVQFLHPLGQIPQLFLDLGLTPGGVGLLLLGAHTVFGDLPTLALQPGPGGLGVLELSLQTSPMLRSRPSTSAIPASARKR